MISSQLDVLSLVCLLTMFLVGLVICVVRKAALGFIAVGLVSVTWIVVAFLPLLLGLEYSTDLWYSSVFHRNLLLILPGAIVIASLLDGSWKKYVGVVLSLAMAAILAVLFY
ncbi:hypothetical protein IC757_10990 [Wenzhouxiangella sp. AB-CW3]|uniref:hypothetical protein n=1 Tax=Wenzhouxiangella sp. AB-CW3 TaxID=2771012 RepID=UPI00168A6FE2|nr:hypothetical protein [Wenzhouxiangella sp. AB-CW3]QOC21566.1 hypothetical protein IC757_10990 [Wenzhouxiangella sp. AB-CW3]